MSVDDSMKRVLYKSITDKTIITIEINKGNAVMLVVKINKPTNTINVAMMI